MPRCDDDDFDEDDDDFDEDDDDGDEDDDYVDEDGGDVNEDNDDDADDDDDADKVSVIVLIYAWRKIEQKLCLWRKMTNIR